MDVLEAPPPSYEFASELPSYTLEANNPSPSIELPRTQLGQEYRYKGDNLTLCLGSKRLGVFRPTYGWNDEISGYVLVRSNIKKVKSIRLHIEGTLIAGISEGGFLVDQTRTAVLKASQILVQAPEGSEDVTCTKDTRYPFTFPLPSYVTGGSEFLPATSSVIHAGMTVNVTYAVKVEMIRNGKLRANERLGTFFNYLPRTFAPPLGQSGSPFNDEKIEEFRSLALISGQWQSFKVLPRTAAAPLCNTAVGMLSPCLLQVSLHLPKPLIYASNSAFPFRIEVESPDNDPILYLFSSLKIDLIRATTISIADRWTIAETVVGHGETKRTEETPCRRIMYGEVSCPSHGESSWHAENIDIKHLLRVTLSPRADSPALSKSLPTFSHYVSVGMRTHLRGQADAHEVSLPALSRLPRQFLGTTA